MNHQNLIILKMDSFYWDKAKYAREEKEFAGD
jgi:hypothetical protein